MTAGLAGADLANIINEAALLAGRAIKKKLNQVILKKQLKDKLLDLKKNQKNFSKKKNCCLSWIWTCFNCWNYKGANKVNKVSIVPRGLAALGYTLNTPEEK